MQYLSKLIKKKENAEAYGKLLFSLLVSLAATGKHMLPMKTLWDMGLAANILQSNHPVLSYSLHISYVLKDYQSQPHAVILEFK